MTDQQMFSPASIQGYINGIERKNRELSMKNDELLVLAEKMANAEKEYSIMYRKKVLECKSNGDPVTLIKDIVRGDPSVAELKFNMDVAEAIYKACKSAANVLVTAIDSYRSLLSWAREEKYRS